MFQHSMNALFGFCGRDIAYGPHLATAVGRINFFLPSSFEDVRRSGEISSVMVPFVGC